MGLTMDLDHVAFARLAANSTAAGRAALSAAEIGQIAQGAPAGI